MGSSSSSGSPNKQGQSTRMLLHVNIQNSVGQVQVVMSPDNTVGELIKTAIDIYGKEKRRPLLKTKDPACYGLHYSSFSLDSLDSDQKLMDLGSRNFFLCLKPDEGKSWMMELKLD